jgi:hypothetical protein
MIIAKIGAFPIRITTDNSVMGPGQRRNLDECIIADALIDDRTELLTSFIV